MRVLIAYDGSNNAAQAASLVGDIVWPRDSILRVISAVSPIGVAPSALIGGVYPYSSEVDDQIRAYFDSALADVVQKLNGPNRVVESAVLYGRPASVIVDEAQAFAPDLVVVGSRGFGSIASLVLGSVSSEVVDHAPGPVLVARQARLTRVIFATDGSATAMAAEARLAQWAIFEDLPIRVVSVADVLEPWHTGIAPTMYGLAIEAYAQDLERAKAVHQRIVDESVARLRAAGRDATPELRYGGAAAEVVAAVGEWKADLVVVGSRGRTGLTRLFLGSVARNLMHASPAS
ncbi:MAG: universal stress protein, partial [Chloroflexota bacterium]